MPIEKVLSPIAPSTDEELQVAQSLALLESLGAALSRGDRARIVEGIDGLVKLRAPVGEQWRQLASVAARQGELGLARRAADLFVHSQASAPAAIYQKASLLFEMGLVTEARAALDDLPVDQPDPVANAYSRGVSSLFLGDLDEARALLEYVTDKAPHAGSAWLALASMSDLGAESQLGDRLVVLESAFRGVAGSEKAAYSYALGKVWEARGRQDLAYGAYAGGAALMKSLFPYDAAGDRTDAENAIRGFSADNIARIADRASGAGARTIFVTGLPRSGTTLVQQILCNCADVAGGGELDLLSLLAREVGGQSFAALSAYLERNGPQTGARLWDHWLSERFRSQGRIVDKSLDTARYLGLVAALLPGAPIIWVTRSPLDCAWSCFRTIFAGHALPWSYDLSDIATHFRLEDRLRHHWFDLLGDRILRVPYEGLVADPPGWTGKIIGHCGLSGAARGGASDSRGAVTSASAVQVRRPIYRDSVGSAESYRPFLQPFLDRYSV